uniref:Odorant receptor n=1 Tax=Leucinodes orbonalis TaxID=711050 RepID=A0AAU0QMJ2_9NEOP|nr:odorant receptor [Leucinodes orbonalis]
MVPLIGMTFFLNAVIAMGISYWKNEFQFVPIFDMRFPSLIEAYKNTPVIYFILFVLCLIFLSFAIMAYVGFDPLVPIFTLHICGQLDILSYRISKVFKECTEEQQINKKLKEINKKLQELYLFTFDINSIFKYWFEYNLKTATFLIPLSLFQVANDLKKKQLNLQFLSFFMSACVYFFIPCYYSNILLERSEHLRQAIYSSDWEKYPHTQARKTITFMLVRKSVPLVLTTIFYPLCLDTYAEMCRQSYTIFNLMNAACT